MVNVIIAGVPKNLKISLFIEFLENNIFQEKIKVSVNYIRWYKRDLKKLSLNMRSNDARKAIRYLNGYEYISRRTNYSLECWKEDDTEDISDSEDTFEPPSKMVRTLSPFDGPDELQVIDHKIELIRKQRILLEEESLLLLQKKRLEMIQNLGPNDFRKLSKLEELSEIHQSKTETRVKGKLRRPDLHGPWQMVYEKMKSVIKAYVDQDRPIFIDLLRSRVKNRLALILKDKGNLKAKEILALYRSIHPEESDINLVQEVLLKINQSIYPIDIATKCNGEKNIQDNTKDEVNFNYKNQVVEKTGMKYIEEVAFYEDVYPDFDNNTKQETPKKELFEINQCTEKEVNDEVIHILDCETNITGAENCEMEVNKPKEINKNECKEIKSNQISEEAYLNIDKDICINKSEFDSLNTNKQTEPAFNEDLDMDNDLDDWVEDETDQQNLGPNDFRKLSKLEELSEINQSKTETRVKGKLRRPDLHGPWQMVYEKMKSVIKAYVDQDRPIFIDLLRSRVKNRLALILKDKGNLKAKEILALYRSIHPEESDINLVQEVLLKINQSIYPIDIATKCNGEKNIQDNTKDEVNFNYKNQVVEKTWMKYIEEVAFYEDVNPDFDNNTKQETPKKELFERNQCTEKEVNDEVIHILDCETNITGAENCEMEVNKPKEINKNECKEIKSNQISEEAYLNIDKDICINKSEFDLLNTNKQTEPAFNEDLDMDNDLDDWVEDETDQQEIKAA